MTPAIIERTRSAGSVNLYQEARTKGEVLTERLGRSEGGKEDAKAISAWLAQASQNAGLAYLRAWIDAREWLRHRVPPQIAEVDAPLETLARVRDHLGRLRERLAQQEKNLRGQSGDVAHNIETQRRKARREVNRLNQELRRVRFGSIHGVQIQVRPVESRERVLRALGEGEAQMLLLQAEMPIEVTRDGLIRILPNPGLLVERAGETWSAEKLAGCLGELALTERALRDGTVFAGTLPKALLLVENVGFYIDVPAPDGWMVAHL